MIEKQDEEKQESDLTQDAARDQSESIDALQVQLRAVRGELSELARVVGREASSQLERYGDRASDARDDVKQRAGEAEDQLVAWIREKPFKASLISMGLGAIFWSLLRRS